jgi:general secretion pathway protein I
MATVISGVQKMNRQTGFTLVEVLVALVVFTVVSVALVRNASISIRQTGMIQDRTIAWWLAENEMTNLRILEKSDENFPGAGVSREILNVGDNEWEIETTIESTENDYVRRVVVNVYKEDKEDSSAELVGFLGRY